MVILEPNNLVKKRKKKKLKIKKKEKKGFIGVVGRVFVGMGIGQADSILH